MLWIKYISDLFALKTRKRGRKGSGKFVSYLRALLTSRKFWTTREELEVMTYLRTLKDFLKLFCTKLSGNHV